jgi:hypothetical protein
VLVGGGFPTQGFQSVAIPQAARGWARPPCVYFKIQSCSCVGSGDTHLKVEHLRGHARLLLPGERVDVQVVHFAEDLRVVLAAEHCEVALLVGREQRGAVVKARRRALALQVGAGPRHGHGIITLAAAEVEAVHVRGQLAVAAAADAPPSKLSQNNETTGVAAVRGSLTHTRPASCSSTSLSLRPLTCSHPGSTARCPPAWRSGARAATAACPEA